MGERERQGADVLFGPDGTSGDGAADTGSGGPEPLPRWELPVVQLPVIGLNGQVTGLAGAEDLGATEADLAGKEAAVGVGGAGFEAAELPVRAAQDGEPAPAGSAEAPSTVIAVSEPSAVPDAAAPAQAAIVGTVAPTPAPAVASEPNDPVRPDVAPSRAQDGPIGAPRRATATGPQRPGPVISRPRPAGRPVGSAPPGPPVTRPVTTAPAELRYRPPVEAEPSILGLSRHARGRAGSRAFTLVFTGIFAVILIQLIVALLNP
ncbi:hypothetical protein ACVGVM_26715 [Pseudonocardia bannensis]|uniref:Uncharacterized protein n=1 Tax=Pseudonocardia bannensis TaxID=630973 RepID=A0A848DK71_9PSEU|nr:hypothetical protein [Pseudonocardia bannensis]NMH93117.1 hypothetical protein [Pseudonocardia bannensis]